MFHKLKSNLKNLTQNYQNNSFYLRNTNADKVIKVIKNFISRRIYTLETYLFL